MEGYLWYFHSDEEGGTFSLGSIVSKPPYARVKRIAITPKLLAEFANINKWKIAYPDHKLPKYRKDIILNTILWSDF